MEITTNEGIMKFNPVWYGGPLKYTKVRDVRSPERGTSGSAGIDLFVPEDYEPEWLHVGTGTNIPSGIKFRVPEGFALIAYNKSGIAMKKKLLVGAEVIDSDYTGEVHINLINAGTKGVRIKPGDKIVQLLLMPVSHCDLEEIEDEDVLYKNFETERGDGAFGSTNDE